MKAKLVIKLIILIPIFPLSVFAQNGYKVGSTVKEFEISKSLNNKTTLNFLPNKTITVIDFFATWCAPCLKALPHLEELQNKFGNNIKIVLVSNEEETMLTAFIKKRPSLSLPIIIDKGNVITTLFQPPSLPYTIVLDQNNKLVTASNAAALTEAQFEALLKPTNEKKVEPNVAIDTVTTAPVLVAKTISIKKSNNRLVLLSQDFMYAAKTSSPVAILLEQLKDIPYDELKNQLNNDDEKKAFWINAYNGFTQYFLKSNKGIFKSRGAFYKKKQLNIAGKLFSLDDVEHGFLRRSKIKWAEGYLGKWFPSATEKELRVNTLDYRIHFALNCGAESCPPIAFYNPDDIDKQLTIATKAYLSSEARYDVATNILKLPKIMSWFRGDFGGKKQMKLLAKQFGIVPQDKNPSIAFNDYNWDIYLDNYNNY